MLGDTAGLACDDVGFADIVQKRRFTVVHVSHYSDDGRTRNQIFGLVRLVGLVYGLLNVHRNELYLESELLGNDDQCLGVQSLVNRHHESEVHTCGDDFGDRHVHHRGKVAHRDEFGDFKNAVLFLLAFHLLVHTGGDGLALVLAVLGSLHLAALGRKACQSVLYLFLHLLVVHFGTGYGLGRRFAFLLVLASTRILGSRAGGSGSCRLRFAYVYAVLGDAFAFFAFVSAAAFSGPERRDVDFAQYLGTRQTVALLRGTEYVAAAFGHALVVGLVTEVLVFCGCLICGRGLNGCRRGFGCGRFRRCSRLYGRRFGLTDFRLFDLRLGAWLGKVYLAQYLGLLYGRADALRSFCRLLGGLFLFFQRNALLLLGRRYSLSYICRFGGTSAGAELLFQNFVHLLRDDRIGRVFNLHALLFEVFGNCRQTHFELFCYLQESESFFVWHTV